MSNNIPDHPIDARNRERRLEDTRRQDHLDKVSLRRFITTSHDKNLT